MWLVCPSADYLPSKSSACWRRPGSRRFPNNLPNSSSVRRRATRGPRSQRTVRHNGGCGPGTRGHQSHRHQLASRVVLQSSSVVIRPRATHWNIFTATVTASMPASRRHTEVVILQRRRGSGLTFRPDGQVPVAVRNRELEMRSASPDQSGELPPTAQYRPAAPGPGSGELGLSRDGSRFCLTYPEPCV